MIVRVAPSTLISESPFVALNVNASPSTSFANNSIVKAPSSSISWSSIDVITGASFTETTFNINELLLEYSPSETL